MIPTMGTVTKKTAKSKTEEFEPFDWQALRPQTVVGLDEVGRGCLAGPVYAAAAIVPIEHVETLVALGVTDSKLLKSEKRDLLSVEILKLCQVGVGIASVDEIDEINILQASFLAMRRALHKLEDSLALSGANLGSQTSHFIVDGHQRIPMLVSKFASSSENESVTSRYAKIQQTTVIKGDLRALPIAAASIVAKVARDRMMIEAAREYPHYGFEKHKGYAAPIHRQAIAEHGPSTLHRKTFGGVREYLEAKLF